MTVNFPLGLKSPCYFVIWALTYVTRSLLLSSDDHNLFFAWSMHLRHHRPRVNASGVDNPANVVPLAEVEDCLSLADLVRNQLPKANNWSYIIWSLFKLPSSKMIEPVPVECNLKTLVKMRGRFQIAYLRQPIFFKHDSVLEEEHL
ncbi:unnamed protein product [Linum trigynum]